MSSTIRKLLQTTPPKHKLPRPARLRSPHLLKHIPRIRRVARKPIPQSDIILRPIQIPRSVDRARQFMSRDHTLGLQGFHLVDGGDPLCAKGRGERFGEIAVGAVVDYVARYGKLQIGDPEEGGIIRVRVAGRHGMQGMSVEGDGEV